MTKVSRSTDSSSKKIADEGNYRTYLIGYIYCLVLTLMAYLLVRHYSAANRHLIIAIIVGLALVQFFVQMVFFLHLGTEKKAKWKLFVFGFMVMVVLIIVFGSLWIMSNLSYRMTPNQVNTYMQNQGGGF